MSSKTRPTTQNGVLLGFASLTLAALTAIGIGAQTTGSNGADREPNFHSLRERGDIKFLPAPLQDRLAELARRPHSYLPLTVFGEAVEPSQLFGYYLLDTTGFLPNVFTSIVPGINDNGVIPTGANFANGGLPTVGAVRVTLEPKPGLPTDPDNPRAFIDMFTDISGLFVINNESGWYEGWMLHDLRVPPVAMPLADGRAQFGTMTPADAAALAALGTGNNVPGNFFTLDGSAARFSSPGGTIPGNTVGFSVSTGTLNAQQQSDVHAYWEFNRGTNWIFPHYELPFTGGLPGTFPALQYGLQSVIPGSGPLGVVNTAATHGDDPNNPRDPDRFEPVSSGQTETRNRFIPSGLTAEIFRNVFTRPASFLPGVTDIGERLQRAYAIEVARVDQNGDGALSFAEADVEGFSDGLPNTRLFLSPRSFNRFFVTREINDGLLAPRFEPSQRAWVLSGFLTLVQPADAPRFRKMPISAEPLVRAALDALRRQMESQLQLRRNLIELDEALAARDRAEAGQATMMGALRAADENLRRLSALMPFCSTCQFTMTIPADPAAIPIVTDGVGELMEEKHWPKEDVFAVQLALQEAVANAIRHGCRGDVSKHVRCSVRCDESGEVVIVVRDPGPGFDPSAIADPLDATNILKPSGRGIFLINELMDEVQFADGGREVQMRKKKAPDLTPASK